MRKSKFRAWDGLRMTTSGIMFNATTGEVEVPSGSQMILMEYIGIKDISEDKVEIYEGDILDVEGDIMEVVFIDGAFKPYNHKKRAYNFMIHIQKYCKVVGNIYQNKELLKEKNER